MLLLAALLWTLEDRVNFGLEVRPILARRCFACHGPDTDGRQAGLALHTFYDAAAVITPGQPDASELFRRIVSSVMRFLSECLSVLARPANISRGSDQPLPPT